jgi:hypothetical protein
MEMMIDKNVFLVKNLFNYEKVISPPTNLPENFETVYLTDNDINCELAKNLGWGIVKKIEQFLNVQDKFERRKIIAFINSFPHRLVPEVLDYKFVFVSDSNIVRIWDEYINFTESCTSKFALFVTSGYYSDERDTIMAECHQSANTERWDYNKNQIISSTNQYIEELNKKNIDVEKLSVVSAKYIGWNLNHVKYELLSNLLYKEGCENLQGNIILSYISGIFPDFVYNYNTKNYSGGILNSHNIQA